MGGGALCLVWVFVDILIDDSLSIDGPVSGDLAL